MEPYQAKIIANLQTFIKSVAAKNISARYAVVAFGGIPELIKPFDSDVPSTLNALNKVGISESSSDANIIARFCNCQFRTHWLFEYDCKQMVFFRNAPFAPAVL
jgi:hypothetical protein